MISFGKDGKGSRARDLARGSYLFQVTEDILVAMEDLGVTKAELAKRLGKSKPRITQLLSGGSNMTIGTLSDIAFELGLGLDKTFKEYTAQRYRVDARPKSDTVTSEPDFAMSSIKNIRNLAKKSLAANDVWSERQSAGSNIVPLRKIA